MWSRVKDTFTKPLDVCVVGPSGAGKTSFVQALCGIDVAGLTRPHFSPRTLEVAGHAVNFVELSAAESDSFQETQRVKPSCLLPTGIIIVVANGYYPNRFQEHSEYNGLDQFDKFTKFLPWHDDLYEFHKLTGKNAHAQALSAREGELVFLERNFNRYLRTFYEQTSRSLEWVLTVVNKADLWWDQRAEVDEFYRNAYQPVLLKVLDRYDRTRGAMPIRKYFSSRIQRFLGNINPSSAFDDDDRWRLNDGLKATMAEALSHSKNS